MRLDADLIRSALQQDAADRVAALDVFAEIESTNSYLMRQSGPSPGRIAVALTDNQTAGRGRHGRTWQSPAGSGLCLSVAYTFAASPANLPALTLAIGLGVIASLQRLEVDDVQLKWPNDLIARDSKLGGILTEALTRSGGAVTTVTGVGLNIDLSGHPDLVAGTKGSLRIMDLRTHVGRLPAKNAVASSLVDSLSKILVDYETAGFAPLAAVWQRYDWLLGRKLTIATPRRKISGIGAGVDEDGALVVDAGPAGRQRIRSGTVMTAADPEVRT